MGVETGVDTIYHHVVGTPVALHEVGHAGILIYPHTFVGRELIEHEQTARPLRCTTVKTLDVGITVGAALSGHCKTHIALGHYLTHIHTRVIFEGGRLDH